VVVQVPPWLSFRERLVVSSASSSFGFESHFVWLCAWPSRVWSECLPALQVGVTGVFGPFDLTGGAKSPFLLRPCLAPLVSTKPDSTTEDFGGDSG
jgi:hypothetical protein